MDEQEKRERQAVVEIARTWLRTPYRHLGLDRSPAIKGVAADCATLPLAVYQEAGLVPPLCLMPYEAQWYLHHSEELYLQVVQLYAREIAAAEILPGDLIVFKWGHCYAHGAVLIEGAQIIHALKAYGCVSWGHMGQGPFAQDRNGKRRPRRFFSLWPKTENRKPKTVS